MTLLLSRHGCWLVRSILQMLTRHRNAPTPPEPSVAPPEVDATALVDGVEIVPRSQVFNDRYQELYRKAGLEVDPTLFHQMEGHVLRVYKPTRMRVRRSCHQCGSELGTTGVCQKCNHHFCRQCTRYPPKRSEPEKAELREAVAEILKERSANSMIWPNPNHDPDAPVVVTRPAKPEQQRVFKQVRQRVRRTCCQCQVNGSGGIFRGSDRDCTKCAHLRCTDCPRYP